ncbi:hypothetical protein ABT084_08210 [Streptomyces sp. NPDC002138]|uniref:hypothetical protein n=1 Tax=Streptomyces sp. NPDC002138 TaxID=3154410 RepID=UPI0033216E8E
MYDTLGIPLDERLRADLAAADLASWSEVDQRSVDLLGEPHGRAAKRSAPYRQGNYVPPTRPLQNRGVSGRHDPKRRRARSIEAARHRGRHEPALSRVIVMLPLAAPGGVALISRLRSMPHARW